MGPSWKDIPEFPGYRVDIDGGVWSCWKKIIVPPAKRQGGLMGSKQVLSDEWHILKPEKTWAGYLRVMLCKEGKYFHKVIHRLVLETFIGPCPKGMQACHENNDRADNKLQNLRWDIPKNNHADKRKHGTWQMGENAPFVKLNIQQVKLARLLHGTFQWSIGKIWRMFGSIWKVKQITIYMAVKKYTWKYI